MIQKRLCQTNFGNKFEKCIQKTIMTILTWLFVSFHGKKRINSFCYGLTLQQNFHMYWLKSFTGNQSSFSCRIMYQISSIYVYQNTNSRITAPQGIYLAPHYHFHSLNRHLDISQAITAGISPLCIGSSRTRTGNLWFPNTSH